MQKVWALKAPDRSEALQYVLESVRAGYSRFGWSYTDNANLHLLDSKSWEDMTEQESALYSQSAFLLQIEEDDWIVHVNVPDWGQCVAARVTGRYEFDQQHNSIGQDYSHGGDFRHRIPVNPDTVIIFDRNDVNVLPSISRRLKLQGRYWRIHAVEDFLESIRNVESGRVDISTIPYPELFYLKNDLESEFASITEQIHRNHPEKKLEEFVARVFERMNQVVNVKRNGAGWGTDYGADLIVDFTSGLPLPGLSKNEKLVVQIKSYEGQHVDLEAVTQIRTAIERFRADAGLIVSTAQPTPDLQRAISELSDKLEKPVDLVAGSDVAKFLFRYGADLVLDT